MSYDFRKDLKEHGLLMLFVAAIAFFLMHSCQAQSYNNGLTLDMLVYRTPVYDSVNDEQSKTLSSSVSIERVRLDFPDKNTITLFAGADTLRLELISIWQNCHFKDILNPDQLYVVIRDRRRKSFFFTFTPAPPYSKPGLYSIHIEPHLPYSGTN